MVAATGEHAPPIHNVLRLAEKAGLGIDDRMADLFAERTRFNLETRYPKGRQTLKCIGTRDYTVRTLAEAKEAASWIETTIAM
ncbi:MAG: hypothetical protein P1P84_10580 [Deferrisomatales bacterium]|nr:hypothetical protein [Deferrisomatales bacterium]